MMGGREGGSSAALYLIDGSTLRSAGTANGIATLDSSGTLTPSQVPASIANGLTYQSTWNATTNTPTLPPVSTPNPGDFWVVTTAGNTALPGAPGPWTVGQAAVFNGTDWDVLTTYSLAIGLPVAGASSGDVLYVDGSGNLEAGSQGDAGFGTIATQDADAVSLTGGTITGLTALSMDGGAAIARMIIDADAGIAKILSWRSDNTPRWAIRVDGAESGANAGADIALRRYDDAGTFIANVWSAVRSTGALTIPNVAITGGSVTGITDLAVADGGTGASTAAGARDGIVWASAAAIDPASPYTVAAGVDRVTFASSKTLAPRALSNYADGQTILVTNSSASPITVTIAPADGTIDGVASVAITVLAHGMTGCQRVSASAWVSLQLGGLSANAIRVYASGSNVYAVAANINPSTGAVTDVGTAVAGTATGTDYSETISGGKITIPAGAASSGAVESNSRRYTWTIAELGMGAWTVASPRIFVGTISGTALSDESEARSGTAAVLVGLGTGTSTLIASTGLARTSTGTTYSATNVIGSGSLVSGAAGSGAVRASMVCDIGYTSSGNRDISTYDSSGTRLANSNSAGATTPSAAPTHVLLMLSRTGTTPSAFSITGLSALIQTVPTR